MIHIGPAGALSAPPSSQAEPDADQFRVGDVWENPQGTRYRVLRVERKRAHLLNEKTGRTSHRAWDDLGCKSGRLWVRVSCGAAT
jgi:hypothetical protein